MGMARARAAFTAQNKARADYLAEVPEINGDGNREEA